ncbi:MAG: hypothetical protein JNN05_09625 [Candidatus Omnitrophica bacterium]|nr:hypothetical protein [Candidatus Omnitrophota bacterium]
MFGFLRKGVFVLTLMLAFNSYAQANEQNQFLQCREDKISFDINKIDDAGRLTGSTLVYEFCISDQESYLNEVKTIAPTVNCFRGSSGHSGCSSDTQYLCTNGADHKGFKSVLCRLSGLTYVKQINLCDFE